MDEGALKSFLEETFVWLHSHPELSYEEHETTAKLKELLTDKHITLLGLPLATGAAAEIGRGGPLVALRADIDGLPITEASGLPYASQNRGRMHACGHDFHAAALLGAAILLKEHEADLPGPAS